jgi:hypothetical protein
MCNPIREGGRRCPIHKHTNLAAIHAVTAGTSLRKRQVENLFRELRREGLNADALTAEQKSAVHQSLKDYAHNTSQDGAYWDRQEASRNRSHEDLDDASYYALSRLVDRAQTRASVVNTELQSVADRTGYPLDEVQTRYNQAYESVDVSRGAETPPEFTPSNYQRAIRNGLPYDRASVVAMERTLALTTPTDTVPRITNHRSLNSTTVSAVGYHEGRMEVSLQNDPTHFHAYQNVPEELYTRLVEAQRPGQVYNRSVQGRNEFMYASPAEAEADGVMFRCGACGQYRGQTHTCPNAVTAVDETEEVNEATPAANTVGDLSRIPERPSATRAELETFTSDTEFTDRFTGARIITIIPDDGTPREVVDLSTVPQQRTFRAQHGSMTNRQPAAFTRRFVDAQNPTPDELNHANETWEALRNLQNVVTPHYINYVRDNLHQTDFNVPVEATFNNIVSPDTPNRQLGEAVVSGTIHVGRVQGTASRNLEEAVIRSHQLRCTCPDYAENYTCVHVRATQNNAFVFLANRSRRFIEGEALSAYISNRRTAIAAEQNIRTLMRDENVDRAGALALVEERRTEAERRRQRELEEAERVRLENSRRAAEQLRRSNASSIAEYDTYRTAMAARWENPEPGYTGNIDAFYADYQEANRLRDRGEAPLDYRTEDVTDGVCADAPGTRSFGVELEFDFPNHVDRYTALSAIGRDLHAAGLTSTASQTGYHSGASNNWASWSFEHDSTVSGELVSPLMKDTPEHWEQLRKATEILTRHGAVGTSRTGSHVHISTGSYESSTAKHAELLRQVNQHEEVMYRLATNPTRGTHRGIQWCEPNVLDTLGNLSSDEHSTTNVMRNFSVHSNAVNFDATHNAQYHRSHVEFRSFDATLDPAVIQRQVMVAAAMTDMAERNVIQNGRSVQVRNRPSLGTAYSNGLNPASGRTHTRESFEASVGTAPQLFDSLFRRHEDRQRVAGLFSLTRWQERRRSNGYDDEDDY